MMLLCIFILHYIILILLFLLINYVSLKYGQMAAKVPSQGMCPPVALENIIPFFLECWARQTYFTERF